ncbi:MAG: enoyl-CoA hydratase/isomerase family protein [Desulfosarcina sp.]|nr:enoyl-CoA hydratase/isomerase family protein [Desulfosarcina sp.]
MDLECIIYDKQEGVAVIRLNRPQVLNAMNKRLWLDMQAALDDARDDEQIKVVVITGEGRAFSTGADLKETIAAINGYAIGSGYELALACDIRIAAEEAKIGSPEAKVTSSVTGGAFRLVQDLIGPGKARELLFTGEYIDGVEAQRIGLVNRAVPPEKLMETVMEMAAKIAANSAFSLKMIKKGLNMALGEVSLEALMDFEVEACLACVSTKERQTSLTAFEDRKK